MLSEYFSNVVGGEILAINIKRGSVFNKKKLGSESPDYVYANIGLFPQIGDKPSIGEYQTVSGPVMQWDSENMVVRKVYAVSDIPVGECVRRKREELASLRYTKEMSGISVLGINVSTDSISRPALKDRIYELSVSPEGAEINWKVPGDGCVKANLSLLTSWRNAVSKYSQDCIDRECELIPLVESDHTTDITTGWPSREIE